jgi:cytokinesis protein
MSNPPIVNAICASLTSPHPPCRKLSAEMMIFFCSFDEDSQDRLGLVLVAFDFVEQTMNAGITDPSKKVNRFDMWLRQLEAIIDGRGRMGSMVGMSKDFKDAVDVHEYCVRTSVI